MNKKLQALFYFGVALTTFCADRITKRLALLFVYDHYPITPWLSFDVIFNRGVSWGMFHSESSLTFIAVTTAIVLLTVFVVIQACMRFAQGQSIVGEVLVFGGSLSNIYDRFLYGGVIDFIHVSYKWFSWPVFNIADACIVVGALLMLYHSYKES